MHISQGIIIAMLFFPYLEFLEVWLVVIFPFLIDFDFLLSKYAKNNNHRRLVTHSLIPYICLLIIGIFFPLALILGICGVVHILSDVIDWGTALFAPFYGEPVGGILPKPPKEIIEIPNYRKRQCWFAKTYYTSKILLVLEILFGAAATVLIILTDLWYLALLLFYFLFMALQWNFYRKCKKLENPE
ncbi:MAG: hypothetical protein HWN65_12785 [Candidatus Helarchaeota archaeon]|nr:hypothetical protein [Candidatus Helarchaeota archaeon]